MFKQTQRAQKQPSIAELQSQLGEIDDLISLQSRKLDLLLKLRDKVADGDSSFSFEKFLKTDIASAEKSARSTVSNADPTASINRHVGSSSDPRSSKHGSDYLLEAATVVANYTLVDLRVLVQSISSKLYKGPETNVQLINAIDSDGRMHLYSESGRELQIVDLSTVYHWGTLSNVNYDGSSPNYPLMVVALQDGSMLAMTFDIHLAGKLVAGQRVVPGPSRKNKSFGIFGLFQFDRTPVDRTKGRGKSRGMNNTTLARSQPMPEVKAKPLFQLQLPPDTDGPIQVTRFDDNGASLQQPVEPASVTNKKDCKAGSLALQHPHVTASFLFFDVNKKSHKIFIGDSKGRLLLLNKNGELLDRLSLSDAPITHIARSQQLVAVAANNAVYFVQLMRFRLIDYTCAVNGLIDHIAFDAKHPFSLYVALHDGTTLVFNTRAKADSGKSDEYLCSLIDTLPVPKPTKPVQLSPFDKRSALKLQAMAMSDPFSREHVSASGEQLHRLSVARGQVTLHTDCALHIFNSSKHHVDHAEVDWVDTLSWCNHVSPAWMHPTESQGKQKANQTKIFRKIFSDSTPYVRSVSPVPRVGVADPITVVGFNTPHGIENFQTSQLHVYIHSSIEIAKPTKSIFDIVKSPMIFVLIGALILYQLYRTMQSARKQAQQKNAGRFGSRNSGRGGRHGGAQQQAQDRLGKGHMKYRRDRDSDDDASSPSEAGSSGDEAFKQIHIREKTRLAQIQARSPMEAADDVLSELSNKPDLTADERELISKAMRVMRK